MFGLWNTTDVKELEYKLTTIRDFETSTSEFYDAIERELEARKLTGLDISRVDIREGGILSPKREYLRMHREQLFFEVCSASFGTTWFFSWRFYIAQRELMAWETGVMLFMLASIGLFYVFLFGLILGSILFVASLLSMLLFMRNTVSLGFQDLDTALLQMPIVGAFYERLFRKETHYRRDTRNAYVRIVREAIIKKIEDATKAGGIALVEYQDATPPSHPAILKMVGDLLRMGQ